MEHLSREEGIQVNVWERGNHWIYCGFNSLCS